MNQFKKIETHAKRYQALLAKLNNTSATIRRKISEATAAHLADLKSTMDEMTGLEKQIKEHLIRNKDLFEKPRTRVIHGLKLGFRKGKGKLIVNDEQKLIERLEKEYDDNVGVLVRTSKKIVKAGIEKLDAKELKRLGVTMQDADDQVVFDVVEDSMDDLINFLLEIS